MATPERPEPEPKPWTVERRAWAVACGLSVLSALLMHLGGSAVATLGKALGDLLVGLSLAMVAAGGRASGYGERGTLPLAVGVGIFAPIVGFASDPHGLLGRTFGALEFFVVGMALAGLVMSLNRRLRGPEDRASDGRAPDGRSTPGR